MQPAMAQSIDDAVYKKSAHVEEKGALMSSLGKCLFQFVDINVDMSDPVATPSSPSPMTSSLVVDLKTHTHTHTHTDTK